MDLADRRLLQGLALVLARFTPKLPEEKSCHSFILES
jgi:hypothetical protein